MTSTHPTRHLARLIAVTLAMVAAVAAPAAATPGQASPPAQMQATARSTATSIAVGFSSACAVTSDGTAVCWGRNNSGQVGDGTTTTRPLPTPVATSGTPVEGQRMAQVVKGSSHTCARTTGSQLACWGSNSYGQLGDGTTTNSSVPVAVATAGTPLEGKQVAELSAGSSHTCALTTDGIVACWGSNGSGPIGTGATSSSEPVPVAPVSVGTPLEGKTIAEIEAGGFNTCALTTDGILVCWGHRAITGTTGAGHLPTPTEVSMLGTPLAGLPIADLSLGRYSACATTGGPGTGSFRISCWGRNADGQLGDGTTTERPAPTAVAHAGTPLAAAKAVGTAQYDETTCAVASGGVGSCWGKGIVGQLGNGGTASSSVPTALVTADTPLAGKAVTSIEVGGSFACALASDGSVACWGANSTGQLGNGTTTDSTIPVAARVGAVPPGAPTGVSAASGPASASVSWSAPADTGGLPVTEYIVTPYRNGTATFSRTFSADRNSVTIGELDAGASYTFTVRARNPLGDGPESAPSNAVVPGEEASISAYAPITPCRIVDTREAGGPFANREIRDYQVTGDGSRFAAQGGKANGCFIPEGTVAVEASVTAVSPADSGFFRAWPSGLSMPNATFMNFDRGMDITNTGALPIAEAEGDELRVRNFGGSAQYVIDIQGYYFQPDDDRGAPAPAEASAAAKPVITTYTPITPCRIVDTREAGGRFGNREIRDYQVTGTGSAFDAQGGKADGCEIPEGSAAVEASITAVGPATSGFFRAWPSGESMPNATFMNFDTGMDITNTGALTLAPQPGHGGGARQELRARNFGGASHYVIDIQGYFTPISFEAEREAAANAESSGSVYVPITPCRIVDTRESGGRFGNREIRDYQVAGAGARFAAQGGKTNGCDIDEDAVAIEGSVTAVGPATSGFFRAWPSGESMPNATFMNFDTGMDITNTGSLTLAELELHGLGTGDQLRARNFGGASHYVIDIQGYFLPLDQMS